MILSSNLFSSETMNTYFYSISTDKNYHYLNLHGFRKKIEFLTLFFILLILNYKFQMNGKNVNLY